jgi:ribosomal protein S27AE
MVVTEKEMFTFLLEIRILVIILYLESFLRSKGVCFLVSLLCPQCNRADKIEIIEFLPKRSYRLQCGRCGITFVSRSTED